MPNKKPSIIDHYLKHLKISNFKCFNNTSVKFAPLTVLVGGNGAGKSSLIQCLLIMQLANKMQKEFQKNFISINEKEKSFLELGSVKQLISSISNKLNESNIISMELNNGKSKTLYFEIDDRKNQNLFFKKISPAISSNLSLFHNEFYYLNAERIGPRNYQNISGFDFLNVGFQGEFTGQVILKISKDQMKLHPSRFQPEENTIKLLEKHIERWMDFIIPGVEFRALDSSELHLTRVEIKKRGSGTDFLHPNNIGFGITYSLPIVVTGLLANAKSMFIVENPEAHLHPKSQSRMGQFLAKMAGTGTQTIIETHSEHIVNGICLGVLKGFIKPEDIIINYFKQNEKGEVEIDVLDVDKDGKLSDWPVGFFDQTLTDYAEMGRLRRQ